MINKKLLRNIIISVAAIAILVGAYYFISKMPDKNQITETPEPIPSNYVTIFETDSGNITDINIINSKDRYTVSKKDKDTAYIKEYPNIDFVSASLLGVFYDFSRITATREVSETLDFGFDKPEAEATVFLKDGASKNFKLGNKVIGDNGYFIKTDDKIYVIADYSAAVFLKSADDFRNRSLAAIDAQSVAALSVAKDGKDFLKIREINEAEKETFSPLAAHVMTYPKYTGVASDKLGEFLQNMTDIHVIEFVSDKISDSQKYGIGKMSLTVKDKDNEIKILYGNKDDKGDVYAVLEGKSFIFTQSSAMFDAADKLDPLSVMEKFIHIINIEKISGVTIVGGGLSYKLAISGSEDNYQYSINGKTVYESDFKAAYQEIIGITANGFTEQAAQNTAEYTVTFEYKDGSRGVYEYVGYDDRNYAARVNGETEYTVLKKKLTSAMDKITEFYNK